MHFVNEIRIVPKNLTLVGTYERWNEIVQVYRSISRWTTIRLKQIYDECGGKKILVLTIPFEITKLIRLNSKSQ